MEEIPAQHFAGPPIELLYKRDRQAISELGPDKGPGVNPKTVIHTDPYLRQ